MNVDFVLPDYRGASLVNVVPSIIARLEGRTPTIPIPEAKRYVIVLIDGLGWELLKKHGMHAERLSEMARTRLTCGVPSTTATSLTSLGCGTPMGEHGVAGYSFYEPGVDAVVNALTWEHGPEDVESLRQHATCFETLADAGTRTATVTLGRFAGSALTNFAFSGAELHARDEEGPVEDTVALIREALRTNDIVYCYDRLLDFTGHRYGVGSWQWLEQFGAADDLVDAIVTLADDDTCVLVTGDHGMVNVPEDRRIVIEEERALDGYLHIGGEGRFRQIYTDDAHRLASRWSDFLGGRATVLMRDDAIDAEWFGPVVTDITRPRIGDVIVAMRDDWAMMSTAFPNEFTLVGMHGSLTPHEMYVPLLSMGGRE